MTDEQFNRVVKFTLAANQTKGAATCDLETARMQGILSPLVDSFRQLPPTRSALYYHALRSAYVSGLLRGQADLFAPELPAFVDRGGKKFLTWRILMLFSFLHGR